MPKLGNYLQFILSYVKPLHTENASNILPPETQTNTISADSRVVANDSVEKESQNLDNLTENDEAEPQSIQSEPPTTASSIPSQSQPTTTVGRRRKRQIP
ncbi:hypothetical protein NQ314_009915 [Rhamnusium bicolor]|uniref:Uncharacterized protein n=1 Tax=Rhamnusium bicolor TaxID=1586634 RepID=A0AAV8XWF3_9CUCU|nr:hypothetical protein NQ314_009915 [Rhamnusium bicolor]